jgi:hypothetical protein
MPQPTYTESVVSISHTATDDNKFKLVTADLWLEDVNIHCYDNNANYGSRSNQNGDLTAGDILTFRYINLNDIFFINNTAGNNTTISAIGVVMPPERIRAYGIPI